MDSRAYGYPVYGHPYYGYPGYAQPSYGLPRLFGIPCLFRALGLRIPRLLTTAPLLRFTGLWIAKHLGIPWLLRTPGLRIPKPRPRFIRPWFRKRISRLWLPWRPPFGGLGAGSRVRHLAFKLNFGLKFTLILITGRAAFPSECRHVLSHKIVILFH